MSLQERLSRLQSTLAVSPQRAYWIEDPISLRYLTGLSFSTGILLVGAKQTALLVDGRYQEMATEQTLYPVFSSEPDSLSGVLKGAFGAVESFALSDASPYSRFIALQALLNAQGKTLLPLEEPSPLTQLRMEKEPEELEALRQAADLGSMGFDYACTLLADGITEAQVAKQLEVFWLQKGGDGLAFPSIIAFGPHSSQPHAKSGARTLQPGDTVLIDIGVKLNGYHSDMTRTLFWKHIPPQMGVIYNLTLRAQEAAVKFCRAGITAGQLDLAARDVIREGGYGEAFSHGLGHGVGLEIHESPRIRSQEPHKGIVLVSGMVITIEPGIYLPGVGGVRIEDTVVVQPDGCEILTKRDKALRVLG